MNSFICWMHTCVACTVGVHDCSWASPPDLFSSESARTLFRSDSLLFLLHPLDVTSFLCSSDFSRYIHHHKIDFRKQKSFYLRRRSQSVLVSQNAQLFLKVDKPFLEASNKTTVFVNQLTEQDLLVIFRDGSLSPIAHFDSSHINEWRKS